MALKDLMKNIGGIFSRMSVDITRRPDGGTSHYRPLRKKAEFQPGEMPQAQQPAAGNGGISVKGQDRAAGQDHGELIGKGAVSRIA